MFVRTIIEFLMERLHLRPYTIECRIFIWGKFSKSFDRRHRRDRQNKTEYVYELKDSVRAKNESLMNSRFLPWDNKRMKSWTIFHSNLILGWNHRDLCNQTHVLPPQVEQTKVYSWLPCPLKSKNTSNIFFIRTKKPRSQEKWCSHDVFKLTMDLILAQICSPIFVGGQHITYCGNSDYIHGLNYAVL